MGEKKKGAQTYRGISFSTKHVSKDSVFGNLYLSNIKAFVESVTIIENWTWGTG